MLAPFLICCFLASIFMTAITSSLRTLYIEITRLTFVLSPLWPGLTRLTLGILVHPLPLQITHFRSIVISCSMHIWWPRFKMEMHASYFRNVTLKLGHAVFTRSAFHFQRLFFGRHENTVASMNWSSLFKSRPSQWSVYERYQYRLDSADDRYGWSINPASPGKATNLAADFSRRHALTDTFESTESNCGKRPRTRALIATKYRFNSLQPQQQPRKSWRKGTEYTTVSLASTKATDTAVPAIWQRHAEAHDHF